MIASRWLKGLFSVGVVAAMFAVGGFGRSLYEEHVAAKAADPPCDEATSACGGHVKAGVGVAEPVRGAPRLLVFSSASCPACKRVAPTLAQAVAACDAAAIVEHVDVDEDEGSALATRYGVSLLPAFVSVDAEGVEVSRLTGVQSRASLDDALGEIRGRRCAMADPPIDPTPT